MTIDISEFHGTRPRVNRRQLPNGAAQQARNCWLTSGAIRPLPGMRYHVVTPRTNRSVYRYRAPAGTDKDATDAPNGTAADVDCWFVWDRRVDFVPSPVRDDGHGRLYWTNDNPGVMPRMTRARRHGVTDRRSGRPASFLLGIPAPGAAVTVAAEAIQTTAASDDAYLITPTGSLYTMNVATGGLTLVDDTGIRNVVGAAQYNDRLYVLVQVIPSSSSQSAPPGELWRIDSIETGNAKGTRVAVLAENGCRDIAVTPTGTMVMLATVPGDRGTDNGGLYNIDPANGSLMVLRTFDGDVNGISTSGPFALSGHDGLTDNMYMTTVVGQNHLWSINVSTAALTYVGPINTATVDHTEGETPVGDATSLLSHGGILYTNAPDGGSDSLYRFLDDDVTDYDHTDTPLVAALAQVAGAFISVHTPPADIPKTEFHSWVYTYVSRVGEEGPPSDPTGAVERLLRDDDGFGPATLTFEAAPPEANDRDITHRRVYRTATGASGQTAFLLMSFQDSDGQWFTDIPIGTTEIIDNVPTERLSDTLVSADWCPPPDGLRGLVSLPNGILAGFVGSTLHLSEPYQPHAWPPDYRQTMDFDIVGLGTFGTSIVVCTTGYPYVVSGTRPDSMTAQRIELPQSCVAKESIVRFGLAGVVYASPDGLVQIGPGSARLLTDQLFTKHEWQDFRPTEILAAYCDAAYVAFRPDGTAFAIDTQTDGVVEFELKGLRPGLDGTPGVLAVAQGLEDDVIVLIADGGTAQDANNAAIVEWSPASPLGSVNAKAALPYTGWTERNEYTPSPPDTVGLDPVHNQWTHGGIPPDPNADNTPTIEEIITADTDGSIQIFIGQPGGVVLQAIDGIVRFLRGWADMELQVLWPSTGQWINLKDPIDTQDPTFLSLFEFDGDSTITTSPEPHIDLLTDDTVLFGQVDTDPEAYWRSRTFTQSLRNYSAAQVWARGYPVVFELWAGDATGTMVLRHTQTVRSSRPFRLPGGYLSNEMEIGLSSAHEVERVRVGPMRDMF